MKNYILNIGKGMIFAGAISLASCTGWFDNVPPYEATEDILEGDNVKVGAFFPQLQRNVVSTHNNQFQLSQNLVGDIYSGYMAIPTNFNSNKNNATYFFQDNWLNNPFEKVYTQAIGAYIEIKKSVDGDENSHIYQWAQILKIASMHRFTDMWGPLPYTQVGSGSMTTPYDSQETVYMKFFEELDKAAEVLTKFTVNNPGSKPMAEYDLVYGGDYSKWVKFANSLRLRLAMHLAFVKPEVAKEQAEKAISHSLGVITSNDDNAGVKTVGANDVVNQLYTMWANYKDIRMGASIWSILTGYEDPRLSKMFTQGTLNETSGYFALRTGLNLDSNKDSRLGYSSPNIQSNTPIIWINAAEVAFLKAEGALRGWNMGGATPQSAYEEGIRLSFNEWGASGANEYMTDEVKTAANYVDPLKSSNNIGAVSNITIGWKENDSKDKKLERIITQKWIATFPNGQEAWTEFRRTGYPKLFPVAVNNSSGTVDTDIQIRRLPFAKSEYTLNPQNIQEAIQLLGGQDNGGTRLWWDIENKSIN
mgnify:FL=1